MKHSIGVKVSAVVTILGSLGALLLAGFLAFGWAMYSKSNPSPPPVPWWVFLIMLIPLAGLSVWGCVTAVGLFRLKAWSRWSILAFSALLAIFAGLSCVMTAIIPLPPVPNAPAGTMSAMRWGIAGFYGGMVLIGAWWLWLFNTGRVKDEFAAGPGSESTGGRPVSVTVIAAYLMFSALFCLAAGFFPVPAMILGAMLTGLAARAVYLALGAGQIWAAAGLWRLKPASRFVAIGYFIFGALNGVLFAVLPHFQERFNTVMSIWSSRAQLPPGFESGGFLIGSTIISAVMCIVPIWFLVRCRAAFGGATQAQG